MAATEITGGRSPTIPDPDAHERIARLSATLCLRPDAEHVRHRLAEAFVAHSDALWPAGQNQGLPEWIAANVDEVLATVERLYETATDDQPGAAEFLKRMAWLPALVDEIAAAGARLDG
jgi:hypothetical protein